MPFISIDLPKSSVCQNRWIYPFLITLIFRLLTQDLLISVPFLFEPLLIISLIVPCKRGNGYSHIWIKKSSPFFNPTPVKRKKILPKTRTGFLLNKNLWFLKSFWKLFELQTHNNLAKIASPVLCLIVSQLNSGRQKMLLSFLCGFS